MTSKLQKLENKKVSNNLPPHGKRPIKVTSLKSAKRLLSRLIHDLQLGTIESRLAKDLTYLLSVYVQISKESDLGGEKVSEFTPIEIKLIDDKTGLPYGKISL